jgi:hypothetical protein
MVQFLFDESKIYGFLTLKKRERKSTELKVFTIMLMFAR